MKDKKMFYIVVSATLFSLYVFGTVLVHAFWYDPSNEVSPTSGILKSYFHEISEKREFSPSGNPINLIIPALKINAKVQNVGITKNGNMATPNNFIDVGWYKYGTPPGQMGSAVMAGHVDNGVAWPGVFKHLEDLKEGNDIYVEMENGEKIHFVITGLRTYDYDARAPMIFNENDARYLKLITCAGVWVEANRTHDKRLVVTAVQI